MIKDIAMSIETKHCNACGKEMPFLSLSSPMILDELWTQVLDFYDLSEHRLGPQLPASTPQLCCYECMEKALGRELMMEDLVPVPFNVYFILHYFYSVPYETVKEIFKHVKNHVLNTPTFKSERLQKEFAFMNGVLMPFQKLQSTGYAKALMNRIGHGLQAYSDQELRDELKRRIAERKAANHILRCRDCTHCGEGCCNKSSRYKTSVCFKKPKPQVGEDRYYAVNMSSKACSMFEKK